MRKEAIFLLYASRKKRR